jgi:hypothetical protein
MVSKYVTLFMMAAVPLSGCATSGMGIALAQNVAGKAVANAQQKAENERRLSAVMEHAEETSRLPGDEDLDCQAILAQQVEQTTMMAEAAEDLGINPNDVNADAATLNAALSAASMTGMAQAVPVAGQVASFANQQRAAQRVEQRDQAELQFYGAKKRNEVLSEYYVEKGCAD